MKTCRRNLHTYPSTARTCPECKKEKDKAWHEAHKEEQKEKRREAHNANREERLAKMKIYWAARKEEFVAKKRAWYAANQEYALKQKRDARAANPEKHREASRKWANANRDLKNAKQRAYYAKNKEKCLADTYRRKIERMATDPLFKLRNQMGGLIRNSIKQGGYSKASKTQELIGIGFAEFLDHLIQTAINNYGFYDQNIKYHIDHIYPCSLAKSEAELLKLQHYSNLQFLTPADNISKSNKLVNAQRNEAIKFANEMNDLDEGTTQGTTEGNRELEKEIERELEEQNKETNISSLKARDVAEPSLNEQNHAPIAFVSVAPAPSTPK